MVMPGFNAEASLFKTGSQYRSAGARFHRNGGSAASQVVASYIPYGIYDDRIGICAALCAGYRQIVCNEGVCFFPYRLCMYECLGYAPPRG